MASYSFPFGSAETIDSSAFSKGKSDKDVDARAESSVSAGQCTGQN